MGGREGTSSVFRVISPGTKRTDKQVDNFLLSRKIVMELVLKDCELNVFEVRRDIRGGHKRIVVFLKCFFRHFVEAGP